MDCGELLRSDLCIFWAYGNCVWICPFGGSDQMKDVIVCPDCGSIEDHDGLGFIYCEDCGCCVHASITNDICDYCGKKFYKESFQGLEGSNAET